MVETRLNHQGAGHGVGAAADETADGGADAAAREGTFHVFQTPWNGPIHVF
jgi:hypothetical protein